MKALSMVLTMKVLSWHRFVLDAEFHLFTRVSEMSSL